MALLPTAKESIDKDIAAKNNHQAIIKSIVSSEFFRLSINSIAVNDKANPVDERVRMALSYA